MTEIEKYKKRRLLFIIIGTVIGIAILIWYLIAIIIYPKESLQVLITVCIMGGYAIIGTPLCFIVEKRRLTLIDKYFGKVSDIDLQKCTELRQKTKTFSDETFELYGQTLKRTITRDLKKLSKKHKVNHKVADFYKMLVEYIQATIDTGIPPNVEFNSYIQEISKLFKANQCNL